MRIVQISDTHLSHLGGEPTENFERLVRFVNEALRPDLVVNTGDVTALFPDVARDKAVALELHRRFDAPVRILPGNHDLGEPGERPWMGVSVTSERVANFRAVFGTDRFFELIDDSLALLGMNSEICSSGLPEEEPQWSWLEECAAAAGDRRVIVFLHKPLWMRVPPHPVSEMSVTDADRERVLAAFAPGQLVAVGSGHLHRYRNALEGDVLTVTAPSSAYIFKSAALGLGLNQLGVVEWRIDDSSVEAYFRATPDLVEREPYSMRSYRETLAQIKQSQG